MQFLKGISLKTPFEVCLEIIVGHSQLIIPHSTGQLIIPHSTGQLIIPHSTGQLIILHATASVIVSATVETHLRWNCQPTLLCIICHFQVHSSSSGYARFLRFSLFYKM